MSYLTNNEIERLQTAGLPEDAPFIIQGVSQSLYSVARHYGGATIQKRHYLYIPPTDELIREDVLKLVQKWRKEKPEAAKAEHGGL